MVPALPPNLIPSARKFLVFHLAAFRLGRIQDAPVFETCDPEAAKQLIRDHCAKYGDVAEELEGLFVETEVMIDDVAEFAMPLVADLPSLVVRGKIVERLRRSGIEPCESLGETLTLYTELLYLDKLKRERPDDRSARPE